VLGAATPTVGAPQPLFGRAEVYEETLRRLHETLDAHRPQLLMVTGEGGVGKTVLLRAVTTAAASSGFQILVGRTLPTEVPPPFGLVEELIRAAQKEHRVRETEGPAGSAAVPLFAAPFDPAPSAAIARATGLADDDPGMREADRLLAHIANPTERVDADRSSFYGRLTDFFLDLARDQPLFLALDDLQFADDSSLEFLRRFVAVMKESRIFILAVALPTSESPGRSLAAVERLAQAPNCASIQLRPMTEGELAEYVRFLLDGREPGRDAVMRWFSQTEGNPLFAEYLVRSTTGLGGLPPDSDSPDLRELLKARVRRMSDAEQRVLVHASVLGKEFDFGTLDIACGQEEERLSEHLDRLVHEGLLREKTGEVYEFVSERVRVDVYAQLTETRRRLLHRKVAQALLERDGVTSSNLYELARQFYLGRDDVRGVDLNRRAAESAARAFAFDTAAVHLERALEGQRRIVPRDVSAEIRTLIELGRYYDELGDLHRSEETLLDAVARSRAVPALEVDLALALLGLAQTRSDLSQYLSSRDLAIEAFQILERLGHRRGLLAAHRVLGHTCWRLGDLEAAEQHQRDAIAIAETDGTTAERGHALIDLANTYTILGPDRLREALALYRKAAELFADIHDPSAEARVLMNQALLHHYAGQADEALRVMNSALGAAERSRSPIWIGYVSLNIAQFYIERSNAAKAKPAVERSAALLEPLGDQLAHQQLMMIRGMVAEVEQRYEDAQQLFDDALRLARDLALATELAEMQFRLAGLAFRRGDTTTARALLTESRRGGIVYKRADLAPRVAELARELGLPEEPPQG